MTAQPLWDDPVPPPVVLPELQVDEEEAKEIAEVSGEETVEVEATDEPDENELKEIEEDNQE